MSCDCPEAILPYTAIYCSSLRCILIKLDPKWYKFCRVRTWRPGRTTTCKALVVRCTLRLCPQLLPGWPLVRHRSEIRLHVELDKSTYNFQALFCETEAVAFGHRSKTWGRRRSKNFNQPEKIQIANEYSRVFYCTVSRRSKKVYLYFGQSKVRAASRAT